MGNDTIVAGNGDDFLVGGDGNDRLTGGGGDDRFIGGAGTDRFVYSAAAETGRDTINDFIIYGRKFRVVAQADTSFRTDVRDISQFYVRNQAGRLLPMTAVASTSVIENAPLISHFNLFRSVEVALSVSLFLTVSVKALE